jgi:threonine aldolase
MHVDFRSDTVTRPTVGMLEAMRTAPLGDDVFGEDPSILALEQRLAEMFGMEAGLFCPSGTMTNQIAIKSHTNPGDEVICDADSHIYQYEGGGIAFNSGCSVRLLAGDRGRVRAEQVSEAVQDPSDPHKPISRLVSLENTANRGGGSCYDLSDIAEIREVCDRHGLSLHLDGARLFNAIVATDTRPSDYGALFDSISICLSKGLGAPVGSVLLGTRPFILKSRRIRKVFGGGMRQAGMLAAAGSYALDHHIDRLAEDHDHARRIAAALERKSFIRRVIPVETNIIIAETEAPTTPKAFVAAMAAQGILLFAVSRERFRIVTHLDITPEMVHRTIAVIESMETPLP